MKICVCIDDDMGISFNRRRQSKDRELILRLCSLAGGSCIFIKEYSAPLFKEAEGICIKITDDFSEARADGICFVECEDASVYAKAADSFIIYRWNRRYPSDVKLSSSPSSLGFTLSEKHDFKGSSHDNITEEIWIK